MKCIQSKHTIFRVACTINLGLSVYRRLSIDIPLRIYRVVVRAVGRHYNTQAYIDIYFINYAYIAHAYTTLSYAEMLPHAIKTDTPITHEFVYLRYANITIIYIRVYLNNDSYA